MQAPAEPEIPVTRSHVQREQEFQKVAVIFIRKAMLPPMWLTAIAHENEMTDNARARAKARGVQPGVFDVHVYQAPKLVCHIELKWGKNKPSDAQLHVAEELWKCGIPRGFAWSMHDVLRELRAADMRLHGNADNMCIEYQARAEAAVATAEMKASRPRSSTRMRVKRATAAQIKRAHAAGVWG